MAAEFDSLNEELPNLKLARAAALSLQTDPVYVLFFADQLKCRNNNNLFAAAVSDQNLIKVYDKESFCSYCIFEGHKETISGLAFDVSNSERIWSSSLDSSIRCWDTTPGNQVAIYEITGENEEPFTAFDISFDGKFLCAGTQQINEEDTFLYVWDISEFPTVVKYAKYDDFHSDDITQVVFHSFKKSLVATGSTDGLVCLCDLDSANENEILLHTFNSESSVNTIGFFGPECEFLYSITHIETVQFWDCTSGDQLGEFSDIKGGNPESFCIDYIVDCFYHQPSQRLFLIAGTFRGKIEILHTNLNHVDHFQSLVGCHSSTIRCILFDSTTNRLLAGGEDGMISLWAPVQPMKMQETAKKSTKATNKGRQAKKPYKEKRNFDR